MIPNCELQVIKDSLESSRKEINITSEHFTTTQHWQSEHFKSVEFISLRHKHKLECPQNHNKLLPRKMKFRQLFGLTSRSQTNMDETRTEDRAADNLVISRSEFDKKYTTCSLLGKGGFGTVYAGYRNRDHLPVAIKVINKNRVMQGKNEHVPIEVALMSMTSHIEGVIKLIEYFELPDCFMLVLERMMSTVNSNKEIKTSSSNVQDLFDFISDNGPLREELARKIFTQLIKTVNQITQAGVIHR